jgi:zinc/manganese transport system substrate-binding protein
MIRSILTAAMACCLGGPALAQTADGRPTVVAAENFYGDVARQLGGPAVAVQSILTNPDDDPHLFEASPSVARALAGAAIVVENGVDYDPWMAKLLEASPAAHRQAIVVAGLVHAAPGANPHLWYDPATMTKFAGAFHAALVAGRPAQAADLDRRLHDFERSLVPLTGKIAEMRARYAGLPVTATEPVFGYMAAALGLAMRNERFQLAVMNDAEPSASDVAAFEDDLRGRRVRVLLYNTQATDDSAKRLLGLARQAGIPVVGVSETEPAGTTYQRWMLDQLDALDHALSAPPA